MLFEASGIRVTHVEAACHVGGPSNPVWRWLSEFQDLYLPTLVEKGYLTTSELAEYNEWWTTIAARPGSLLFAPPVLCVVGARM
jgi:hypothetical protein